MHTFGLIGYIQWDVEMRFQKGKKNDCEQEQNCNLFDEKYDYFEIGSFPSARHAGTKQRRHHHHHHHTRVYSLHSEYAKLQCSMFNYIQIDKRSNPYEQTDDGIEWLTKCINIPVQTTYECVRYNSVKSRYIWLIHCATDVHNCTQQLHIPLFVLQLGGRRRRHRHRLLRQSPTPEPKHSHCVHSPKIIQCAWALIYI